jgi:CheY-like chemotaxis protein
MSAGRILVVDDEDDIRAWRRSASSASAAGRSCRRARPREAVAAAEGGGFDAVLLDVMMPDVDGPATLERLRPSSAPACRSSSSPRRCGRPTSSVCAGSARSACWPSRSTRCAYPASLRRSWRHLRRAIAGSARRLRRPAPAAAAGGGGERERPGPVPSPAHRAAVGGMQVPARATSTAVQLGLRGGFRDRFWAGVNLGSTTPGHLPGEVSARAGDYRRWFPRWPRSDQGHPRLHAARPQLLQRAAPLRRSPTRRRRCT